MVGSEGSMMDAGVRRRRHRQIVSHRGPDGTGRAAFRAPKHRIKGGDAGTRDGWRCGEDGHRLARAALTATDPSLVCRLMRNSALPGCSTLADVLLSVSLDPGPEFITMLLSIMLS